MEWKLVPVEPTLEIAQALDLPRFPFSLEYNPERWRAAVAAAPTPPAQEDVPVYQLRFDGNTWFDTPKEQYDYFTSKEREVKSDARILYTRPQSDKLRKAAEEVVSRFDRYMLEESRLPDLITAIENLRSALERK
jgi:hypothetical protein